MRCNVAAGAVGPIEADQGGARLSGVRSRFRTKWKQPHGRVAGRAVSTLGQRRAGEACSLRPRFPPTMLLTASASAGRTSDTAAVRPASLRRSPGRTGPYGSRAPCAGRRSCLVKVRRLDTRIGARSSSASAWWSSADVHRHSSLHGMARLRLNAESYAAPRHVLMELVLHAASAA